MNQKYVYGYQNGWNVENEYINSLNGIMDEYNDQVGEIEAIEGLYADYGDQIRRDNLVTDEQIREWYEQDVDATSKRYISFEDYKQEILNEMNKKQQEKENSLSTKGDEYFARLYYLIEVKNKTRIVINERRKELELLLSEKKLELSSINLEQRKIGVQYDENHNILNSEQLKDLRKRYDDVFLEIRKIEHALRTLDDMFKLVEFTQEETDLMMSGLTPKQKEIYDGMRKPVPPTPNPNPEPVEETIEQSENSNEYEQLLDMYNQDLETLYELQNLYENEKIEYSEYAKFADYMVGRYKYIIDMYEELSKNGKELQKPEQPMMIMEKENKKELVPGPIPGPEPTPEPTPMPNPEPVPSVSKEEQEKYTNLKYLIEKAVGSKYKYTPLDSFIYSHKEIKCFNWNKKRERTFLDKPMRIFKTAISTVILGGSKLFSKAMYTRKDVKERIEYCLDRIEKLSEEEVMELFKGLGATRIKDWQNIIPKVAFEALYRRVSKIVHAKVNLYNSQLKIHCLTIVKLYKEVKVLKNKLNSASTIEERKEIEDRLKQISSQLCQEIIEYKRKYKEADAILNASGLYGFSENFRARRTTSIGGRNARYFDSRAGRAVGGKLGGTLQEAIRNGDGITAAEAFIYDHQVEIENTEEKRTLKNRFGKASTGIYQYSPLVEEADYSEDEYLKDVLQSIMLVSTILNAIHVAKLQEEIANANSMIQAQNMEISRINQEIDQLKGIFKEYDPTNPDEFLTNYHTVIKRSIGQMQGNSEYLGMQAQAGGNTSLLTSSGPKYKLFDDHSHRFFGDLDRQIDAIYNDPSIPFSDKILKMGEVYEQGAQETVRQTIHHQADVLTHINKYGGNYDFASVKAGIDTAMSLRPEMVTNVFNEYCQAAAFVNNMQALSYINTIDTTADLTYSLVTLAAMVGSDAVEAYRTAKKQNPEKFAETDIDEIKAEMLSVKIDTHEIAKKNYEDAKAEWDKKGAFYKLLHTKEKPKRIDFDEDVLKQEGETAKSI